MKPSSWKRLGFAGHSVSRWALERLGMRVLFVALGLASAPVAWAALGHMVTPQTYRTHSEQAGMLKDGNVVFSGRRITIPVIAGAPGAPDTTFEIHGQVNPTLIVPAGAKIRFELANADEGMTHALDVTRQSPPYDKNPALPMQKPSKGSGEKASVASGAITGTGVLPPASKGHWTVNRSAWVTLAQGSYYYVCPVPGHARDGMYGRIVVKARGNGKPD